MTGERPISIERIQDVEGILIGSGNVLVGPSEYEEWVQKLAQEASGDIVALRVDSGEKPPFLWIDGEILPGEKLRNRFSDPSKSPELSELAVISRTGSIFTAKGVDSVISSKPTPGVK